MLRHRHVLTLKLLQFCVSILFAYLMKETWDTKQSCFLFVVLSEIVICLSLN